MGVPQCPKIRQQCKLWFIKKGGTWGTGELQEPLISETLSENLEKVDLEGTTGDRDKDDQNLVDGAYTPSGRISCWMRPAHLQVWLELALWGTPTGNTFPLGDTPVEHEIVVKRGDSQQWDYGDMVVNTMTVTGEQKRPIQLDLDVIGKTYLHPGTDAAAVAIGTTVAFKPYMMFEAVLNCYGESRPVDRFQLVFSNNLVVDHKMSQSPSIVCGGLRTLVLSLDGDWTDEWRDEVYKGNEATGSLVFTRSAMSSTWTFGKLMRSDRNDPQTPGGAGKVPYSITLQSRKTGATPVLSVVNDSVP